MVWHGMVWHCMVWTEIRAANMALCAGAAFHIIESTQWRAEGGPADRNIILSFLLNCQNISTFTIKYMLWCPAIQTFWWFANSAILVAWGPDPIYTEVQYMLTFISKKYWGVKKIESFPLVLRSSPSIALYYFHIHCLFFLQHASHMHLFIDLFLTTV